MVITSRRTMLNDHLHHQMIINTYLVILTII